MARLVPTTGPRLLIALLLLLASCGGGGRGGGGGGGVDGGDTTSSDPVTTGGTGGATRIRIERPSGTPLGEVIPPGDDAYLLLSRGRCTTLLERTGTWRQGQNRVNEDAFFLYKAAAEACLQRWDDAQRDYDRLLKLDPSFSGDCDSTNCEACMRAVQAWLEEVLAARRRDPEKTIEYVNGTEASPCPEPGRGTPDDQRTTTTEEATTTSRGNTSTSRTTRPSRTTTTQASRTTTTR